MRNLLLLLLMLSFSTVFSQQTGIISGSIDMNESKPDLKSLKVTLKKLNDTSAYRITALNSEGRFEFTALPFGSYKITIIGTGYKPYESPFILLNSSNVHAKLEQINIQAEASTLSEVTITAQRQMVEHKTDRIIVNVGASITNEGSNALEVLEKSPGITIDKDGAINLKGKQGAQIFIDGRPAQMEGIELLNYLRNMSASQMDQVEIMTNPPASYDAAGNAGIINIKTKKIKTFGMNGNASINYTQGIYPKTNQGFNFNYRINKFNLYTSLNYGYNKQFEKLTIQRRIRQQSGNILNYFDQEANETGAGNSYNGRIGMDYFAGKNSTIGFSLSGAASNYEEDKITVTNIANSFKELENITIADITNKSKWNNFSSNLYFRRLFDSSGKELSADLDYAQYNSRFNQFMINSYYDNNENNISKSDSLMGALPQDINIYSGKIDYVHPLKKGKFEAGIKSSLVKTDNDARYDSLQYGQIRHDYLRSNHFIYEENINAAYANWSGPLSTKFEAQLGLRIENTRATGKQITTGENFSRNYTELFPTAYLQYKAGKKHNIGINYGRRIRRPNYSSLNPFLRYIDRYTYSKGNPDLQPQFSHNFELSHTYANFLSTTLNYTRSNNIIQQVLEQKGNEAYTTLSNIATHEQIGLAVSMNKPINKFWSTNMYVNVYHNKFNGLVNQDPLIISGTRVTISTTQQFKITKSFSAELSANYRSGGVAGVIRIDDMYLVNAGFNKNILKNKGSIRLAFRDIFYSLRSDVTARYGNVDANFQEINDTRTVTLGFTYRFSKGKQGSPKKRNTGSADEEQQRVGL